MGPNIITKYPLDRTGSASTNLVTNEAHTVGVQYNRIVAPNAGPYYEDTMVVYDSNGNELKRGTDWDPLLPYVEASMNLNKPVANMLVIKNKDISEIVLKSYQVPGGVWSTYTDAIIKLINSLMQDTREVRWDDIGGKPERFKPTPHLHHLKDLYGFEYEVLSLEEILRALQNGDVASHDVIYQFIQNLRDWVTEQLGKLGDETADLRKQIERLDGRIDGVIASVNQLRADLNTHIADKSNPHQVTKAQTGLGNVENYSIATDQEAIAATARNRYLVPAHLAAYATAHIIPKLDEHIADHTNPHQVTKAQVGLGNVLNYNIAEESHARDGSLNTMYMTPLRTAQGVDQQFTLRRGWGSNLGANAGKYVSPDNNGYTRIGTILAFMDSTGERARWYWDGSALNSNVNINVNDCYIRSDERVKNHISYLKDTEEEVTPRLRVLSDYVARYQLNDAPDSGEQIGTIAQGYLKTFPEVLSTNPITGIYSIRPTAQTALLLRGWYEHDKRLAKIEKFLEEKLGYAA